MHITLTSYYLNREVVHKQIKLIKERKIIMAKIKTEAGSNIYLWHDAVGTWATENRILVSAHGTYTGTTGSYTIPSGVSLHFYCNQSDTVKDVASCASYVRGAKGGGGQAVVETLTGNVGGTVTCTNYKLKKYQEGSTAIKEAAADAMKEDETLTKEKAIQNATAIANMFGETYEKIEKITCPEVDVCSIRNRWWRDGVNLSEVMTEILKVHAYTHIHCLFCRELK